MSDHLPECPYVVFDQQGQIPATVIPGGCICRSLRACEQRVREDMALQYLVSDREQQEQEERAFAAGVQAARDAVADARTWPTALTPTNAPIGIHAVVIKDDALAVIDALKTK